MAWKWTATFSPRENGGHIGRVEIKVDNLHEAPDCLRAAADHFGETLGHPACDLAAENAGLRSKVEALNRHLIQLQSRGVGGGCGGYATSSGLGAGGGGSGS